jgi:hypothetical protein
MTKRSDRARCQKEGSLEDPSRALTTVSLFSGKRYNRIGLHRRKMCFG